MEMQNTNEVVWLSKPLPSGFVFHCSCDGIAPITSKACPFNGNNDMCMLVHALIQYIQ
jgi:hypothetical protein